MGKDIRAAVREICLALPEVEERPSHGFPDYRVRGRSFASFVVNHHGDGRIALWVNAPPGAQTYHTEADPSHYFVPPYVGPRGWLGIHLDRGLTWQAIALRVREAYQKVAPRDLAAAVAEAEWPQIEPPTETLSATEFDPLQSARAQQVIGRLREICLAFPETTQATRFGSPVWLAGKKTFANAYHRQGRLTLAFWAGTDRQATLTFDPRYHIPAYVGHNGWIALDVDEHCDWDEVSALAEHSYRHFALKRMLTVLNGGGTRPDPQRSGRRPRTDRHAPRR
jgi:predicted DNA-binding protein (MmcQ/YjbR family)